jgi:hypothetical protein
MHVQTYQLQPVGWVESPLTDRDVAPKQGDEVMSGALSIDR